MQFIGNPRVACTKIHSMMAKLMDRIKELKGDPKASGEKFADDPVVVVVGSHSQIIIIIVIINQ